MKRNRNKSFLVGVAAIFALSASAAFGQYGYYGGAGACGPTACEAPTYAAPSCDAPTCDVPSCDVPACDVPTCAPEACEPVGCGYYGGISGDYCGEYGGYCGGICIPFCDVSQLVGGVLNVATTPFHWVASMLTDGIYDGCGCAPAPARTPCNPCDICGNYVGGCNDYCQVPYRGNGGTVDVYGDPVAPRAAAPNVGSNGSYPVDAYDAEQYDASPSRRQSVPGIQAAPQAAPQNAAPESLPAEAIDRAAFAPRPVRPAFNAQAFNVRSFNVQTLVGNAPAPNAVRQVRYEERRAARPLVAAPQAQVQPQTFAAPVVENASSVSENRPARKTYGQVRPNQTVGGRVF